MFTRTTVLAGLVGGLLLAMGAFATPGVRAEVASVECEGMGPNEGLTLAMGETAACQIELTDDENDLRITSSAHNPVEITSPSLQDKSPEDWDIVVAADSLGTVDADSDVDPLDVVFEYECQVAARDTIIVIQVNGPPATEVVNFPVRCQDVVLSAPSTVTHDVKTVVTLTALDDNGGTGIGTSDGVLAVTSITVGGSPASCTANLRPSSSIDVDTKGECDSDTNKDVLVVTLAFTPDCPASRDDVVIGAAQGFSKPSQQITCLPPSSPTTPGFTPPGTGDAGIADSSGSDAGALFILAGLALAALAGLAGVRLARR